MAYQWNPSMNISGNRTALPHPKKIKNKPSNYIPPKKKRK